MLPLELYWPPEMLAQVFPDRYRHLVQPHEKPSNPIAKRQMKPQRYTIEARSGCKVFWLGRMERRRGLSA